MAEAITSTALVYTPHSPLAVAQARNVIDPEACLHNRATLLDAGASLVLDFGEELVGVFELTGEAEGETKIELIEGEDLEEALLVNDPFPPAHWYHQPRDILNLEPGAQTARNQGRRAFRYVNLIVHGPGRLRLSGAKTILEHAPVTDRGSFKCSDPLLNAAWAISRRTLRLCMQGFYEDGVKRDGMLWIGDYRVEFLCSHYLFADAALARRSLEMFAQCRHPNGSLSAVALHAGGHLYPRISYLGELSKPGGLHEWVLDIQPAGRSHCHGWSAGPACLLPAYVLGVTPTAPGYRTVAVRPALGDLAWAEGTIPTPHGDIRVSLKSPLNGEIVLPEGITGMLHLPGREPQVLSAGRAIFQGVLAKAQSGQKQPR